MRIMGIQKLTLLDYPGHIACTIFTHGCNFRCPFCHNKDLVLGDAANLTPEGEIFSFLKKRVNILEGVCITGGEPLLQVDIIPFIKKIKDMGFLVKLDTNGSFPDKLRELISLKLVDYVAMDIKNSKEKYGKTIGINNYALDKIEESINILINSDIPYEFRTTVVEDFHDNDSFKDITKWISKAKNYYLQCFVDSGNLIDSSIKGYSKEKMEEFKNICVKNIPTSIRGM